jgi:hypothetical protein
MIFHDTFLIHELLMGSPFMSWQDGGLGRGAAITHNDGCKMRHIFSRLNPQLSQELD